MCNAPVRRESFGRLMDPFSFSTFHLLRTCNRLMLPADLQNYYTFPENNNNHNPQKLTCNDPTLPDPPQPPELPLPSIRQIFTTLPSSKDLLLNATTESCSPPATFDATCYPSYLPRRSRGEKRPIPDDQKDEKYFERRKRNNEAAKKSRDARKLREDRIAFRAALLEQENAILKTQVVGLREEVNTLRQVIGSRAGVQL